jgi:hypothetical protein
MALSVDVRTLVCPKFFSSVVVLGDSRVGVASGSDWTLPKSGNGRVICFFSECFRLCLEEVDQVEE